MMSKTEKTKSDIQNKPLMALDMGKKRIGIATCDPGWVVVTPLQTLHRIQFTRDAADIIALMVERQIGGLVIGLPLNMDGSEGPMCQSVRDFARELQNQPNFPKDCPVFFQDERLTSQRAEQFMIEELDLSRQKRKKAIDQLAAVQILEQFIY